MSSYDNEMEKRLKAVRFEDSRHADGEQRWDPKRYPERQQGRRSYDDRPFGNNRNDSDRSRPNNFRRQNNWQGQQQQIRPTYTSDVRPPFQPDVRRSQPPSQQQHYSDAPEKKFPVRRDEHRREVSDKRPPRSQSQSRLAALKHRLKGADSDESEVSSDDASLISKTVVSTETERRAVPIDDSSSISKTVVSTGTQTDDVGCRCSSNSVSRTRVLTVNEMLR